MVMVVHSSMQNFYRTIDFDGQRQGRPDNCPRRHIFGIQKVLLYQMVNLAFVSKVQKQLFTLDLDKLTYTAVSTETSTLPGGGTLDDQPDHVIATSGGVLLLSEDGGSTNGLFAYDGSKYLTFFESNYSGDEVVGIACSPDRKYMLVCIQDVGLLFQLSRNDGQIFEGRRVLKWRKDIHL
jgi:hypothetical protein